MLRVALPIAAERLKGRQQASVDNAVIAAATGMALVEGFMMLVLFVSLESPRESIHDPGRPGASHSRDMNGNSRRNETNSIERLPDRHLSHRLEQLVSPEITMSLLVPSC